MNRHVKKQLPSNKVIVIAVTGTPPEKALNIYGDFSQWISTHSNTESPQDFCVVDTTQTFTFPESKYIAGVIITGSPAMVTAREPWSLNVESWITHLIDQNIPILGICYGHQLLAQALGGKVDFHPLGREIGTVPIKLTHHSRHDPLFSQSPSQFYANVTHAQSVVKLPPGSVLLGKNDYEPIQAFRFHENVWGVQFHPEFTADIMRFYLFERFDSLKEQGLDIKELFDNIKTTPDSRAVLDNFIALCLAPNYSSD